MTRIIALIVIVGAAATAVLHFTYPAVAAASCPSCYGFTDLSDGVYVEGGMPPDRRAVAKATVEAARTRVRGFYGDLQSNPRVLLCATEACYRPFGGGSRGITLLDRALILSPRGTDTVIAAHELAHAELHRRIGLTATLTRSVPQWFDEGLAVVVSDDPRYLAPGPDRCRAEPGSDLPASRAAWIETAESAGLYARAACKVSRWLDAHGGAAGILRLVANGSFGEITADIGS
ncbi:hypothetical protein [Methylobacterium sp. PvR107]|uniref:hypothetical protein n=1 Tax=Methylobacterium sp. PvR107 TaxID=2806597 RepID=UPI001AE5E6CD|nr:hypothetical protein [Methylobacterium sp. PvR107]MBP1181392.1 hypothetical protein [Methylobacterium sp. PvR107]